MTSKRDQQHNSGPGATATSAPLMAETHDRDVHDRDVHDQGDHEEGPHDQGPPILLLARQSPTALLHCLDGLARTGVIGEAGSGQASARFGRSGCHTAIVDLRDPDARGINDELLATATDIVKTGGSVIVIADREEPLLGPMLKQGATQWLPTPADPDDLDRLLVIAERQAERLRRRVLPVDRRARHGTETATDPEAHLLDKIAQRLSVRHGALAVMRMAFTRLEMVNTAFGRETGDALIEAAAGRVRPLLASVTDGQGYLARTGGAELTAIVEGIDGLAQDAFARAAIERIERPFVANGHVVSLGCRIGIAEWAEGDEAHGLFRRASAALIEARLSEASPYRRIDAADAGALERDASLQQDLRRAVERDEIEIVYQPQLAIGDGAMVGVEALARWRHPRHGALGASVLFAVAARADCLASLSAHIQKCALSQAARWPEVLAGLRLSINVTAGDISQSDFATRFFAMVDASGFPRNRLTVEITESGLIENLEQAAIWLATLRKGGVRVAIDDFGTGYSSLAYLKSFPLDYLKIDRQMAQDIVGTKRDRIVVRSVIDMGRSLGLAVIAEGVETEAQLAALAREGCNLYQGFLFAGPVESSDLPQLVEAAETRARGRRRPRTGAKVLPIRAKAATRR